MPCPRGASHDERTACSACSHPLGRWVVVLDEGMSEVATEMICLVDVHQFDLVGLTKSISDVVDDDLFDAPTRRPVPIAHGTRRVSLDLPLSSTSVFAWR